MTYISFSVVQKLFHFKARKKKQTCIIVDLRDAEFNKEKQDCSPEFKTEITVLVRILLKAGYNVNVVLVNPDTVELTIDWTRSNQGRA